MNYLRPDLKRESFSPQEENMIVFLHATIGSRWSTIAQYMPGRTDNDVKNYWNTKLKKKLVQEGIDPITHKPISEIMLTLGGVQPSRTSATNETGKNGRISCLNRDLKNVFMSRSDSVLDPMVAIQNMPETSGYDLLTQLQAIRLVADVSNGATPMPEMTTVLSELPQQICTSTSTCASTAAPVADSTRIGNAADDLNWSDFLVDDIIMCIDDGRHKEVSSTPSTREVIGSSTYMDPMPPSLLLDRHELDFNFDFDLDLDFP